MGYPLKDKLKIAITTRALFQLEEENKIFEEKGEYAYERYQMEHEKEILKPGASFPLVKSLLKINEVPELKDKVEILIVSRNSANSSLRVFHSIKEYGLNITRGAFTRGESVTPYIQALDVDLFLTANSQDAQMAIDAGIPAAKLEVSHSENYDAEVKSNEIRIAFDADAVVFSEDSEIIYKTQSLEAFKENEANLAEQPMKEGPFAKFLKALSAVQNQQQKLGSDSVKIRTAIVTARNAPAHERVIKTLRKWDVMVDEVFFLGGIDKAPFLKAFRAQIFFDDQKIHSEPASEVVPSGTVPYKSESLLKELEP